VALKDTGFEATRSSVAGKAGRCNRRGDPQLHREAQGAKQGAGETRNPKTADGAKRMWAARQLEAPSPAEPEDAAREATCGHIGRRNWSTGAVGQPWHGL